MGYEHATWGQPFPLAKMDIFSEGIIACHSNKLIIQAIYIYIYIHMSFNAMLFVWLKWTDITTGLIILFSILW